MIDTAETDQRAVDVLGEPMDDQHPVGSGKLRLAIGDEVEMAHRNAIETAVAALAERAALSATRTARLSRAQAGVAAALNQSRRDGSEPEPAVLAAAYEVAAADWAAIVESRPE